MSTSPSPNGRNNTVQLKPALGGTQRQTYGPGRSNTLGGNRKSIGASQSQVAFDDSIERNASEVILANSNNNQARALRPPQAPLKTNPQRQSLGGKKGSIGSQQSLLNTSKTTATGAYASQEPNQALKRQ